MQLWYRCTVLIIDIDTRLGVRNAEAVAFSARAACEYGASGKIRERIVSNRKYDRAFIIPLSLSSTIHQSLVSFIYSLIRSFTYSLPLPLLFFPSSPYPTSLITCACVFYFAFVQVLATL